jgi:hypothetical protein
MEIPSSLARNYHILELEKRKGAKNIQKIFGVKPFEFSDAIEIKEFDLNQASTFLEDTFEKLKPIIYAIRFDDDKKRNLSKLKGYRIKLCERVEYKINIGVEQTYELNNNEYVPTKDIAYISPSKEFSDFQYPIKDPNISRIIGEIFTNILKADVTDKVQLICDSLGDDAKIIQRLSNFTGGDGNEKLLNAKHSLGKATEEDLTDEYYSNHKTKNQDIQISMLEQKVISEAPQNAQEAIASLKSEVTLESINRIGAITPNIKKKIRLQIVKAHFDTKRVLTYSKTNPDRAQNIAEEIEKEQGRFPYDVSGKRGEEGYGCDLLSFRCIKDMEMFRKNEGGKIDFNLVLRFIEVKGGSTRESNLLGGNELESAKKYKEKFFIYRIYENPKDPGKVEFFELQNPINVTEALEPLYRLNVHNTNKTTFYEVKIY